MGRRPNKFSQITPEVEDVILINIGNVSMQKIADAVDLSHSTVRTWLEKEGLRELAKVQKLVNKVDPYRRRRTECWCSRCNKIGQNPTHFKTLLWTGTLPAQKLCTNCREYAESH